MIHIISTKQNPSLTATQKYFDNLCVCYETISLRKKGNLQRFTYDLFMSIVRNLDPMEHDDIVFSLFNTKVTEEERDLVYDMTLREMYDYIIQKDAEVLKSMIVYDDTLKRVFVGWSKETFESTYEREKRKKFLDKAIEILREQEDKNFVAED